MKKIINFFRKLDLWINEVATIAAVKLVCKYLDPPVPKKTDPLNWYIVAHLMELYIGQVKIDTRLVLARVESYSEIDARKDSLEYFEAHPLYGAEYRLNVLYTTTEPMNPADYV